MSFNTQLFSAAPTFRSASARARIGWWPDVMQNRIGNWPDPMQNRIGNWPDPMGRAVSAAGC